MAIKTEKPTADVVAAWPVFKASKWPIAAGPQPNADAIATALATCRPGTSVALAQALRARSEGATPNEVSAATMITGNSGQHRNKLGQLLAAGRYVVTAGHMTHGGSNFAARENLPQRDGQTVLRIALPGKVKPARKAAGKAAGKRKAPTKPVAPPAPSTATEAPQAPSTATE